MDKDFENWNRIKQEIELRDKSPLFKEREICWCCVGVNVGYEVLGKGKEFARPVLILRKHNRESFFGLPLGSARKKGSIHHFPLDFNGRKGSVFITQGRTLSSRRLTNRMGALPETIFDEIMKAFKNSF